MLGYFVTGTDTGVGKTEIACALANKHKARVRKPIESGCEIVNGELFPSDAHKLHVASGRNEDLNLICKYRFQDAISPESAAIIHQQNITADDLANACASDELVIVEGAGGFLSPIAINATNADLAVKLNLPIVLVVANRLGCINHTLLTLEAIKARNLSLDQIYLIQNSPNDEDYFYDLQRWLNLPIFGFKFSQTKEPWRSFELI